MKNKRLTELILNHRIVNMLKMQIFYFQHCGAVILLIFKLKEHGIVF